MSAGRLHPPRISALAVGRHKLAYSPKSLGASTAESHWRSLGCLATLLWIRHHSAEEKIRIVLEGLRGEESIAELCRKEGINQNLYYRWSKEFLEAGKKRLAGDTAREATSDEVKELKAEATVLRSAVPIQVNFRSTKRFALLKRPGRQGN